MIALALKWMTIAIGTLAVFSALTCLYGFYELKLGACRNGCARAQDFETYMYVGLVGAVGFSVSAWAAFMIRKSFLPRD